MTLRTRLPLLMAVTAFATTASTISFLGPEFPVPNTAAFGVPCNLSVDLGCVFGDPGTFAPFSATLTQPSADNAQFTLTIQTNYGDPSRNLIPGSPDVVPAYVFEPAIGSSFFMGDFMITVNGTIYGLVMHPHDGYTAGSLYLAPGYQTAYQLMNGKAVNISNPNGNVLIAAGGTLAGAGILTGAQTGDAVTTGKYTLTDEFSAPAGFLADGTDFGVYFATYACANGVLTGTGSFTEGTGGGGEVGGVPEPNTIILSGMVLSVFGLSAIRRRLSSPAFRAQN